MLISTFGEFEKLFTGKDGVEFSFIGKGQTTYSVIATKVYESTIKEYPRVNSTGYKFTITFNGNRIDSKIYNTKQEIIDSLKVSLGEFGFKEKVKSDLPCNIPVDFESSSVSINFDSIGETPEQKKKNPLQDRIDRILAENPHKTFNKTTVYARIVCDDLGIKWIGEKGTNGWLLKFDRVGGFYMIYKNKQDEVLERYNQAKTLVDSKKYPFKVVYKQNKNNYIIEIEDYNE